MSTDAIDDPMEGELRQQLSDARRKEDAGRHADPETAAGLREEAWQAWQRLETYLRAKGAEETLRRDFGDNDTAIPEKGREGVKPVVPGVTELPEHSR